jgi:hypothetical protein
MDDAVLMIATEYFLLGLPLRCHTFYGRRALAVLNDCALRELCHSPAAFIAGQDRRHAQCAVPEPWRASAGVRTSGQ